MKEEELNPASYATSNPIQPVRTEAITLSFIDS